MDAPSLKFMYLFATLFTGIVLGFAFDRGTAWTLTHLIHNIVRLACVCVCAREMFRCWATTTRAHTSMLLILRWQHLSQRQPRQPRRRRAAAIQVTYVLFHTLVGVPADDVWANQGIYNRFTMWEQIDRGTEYSRAKKMLTIFPIILYGAQPATSQPRTNTHIDATDTIYRLMLLFMLLGRVGA